MEHRIVPSLRDVKESKLAKIADDIKNAEMNESAVKLLAILEEDMDMAQIALKLLSNLLQENAPVGPDKIGLDKKTLENVVRNIEERENSRGGRGGGRRDGRSGGYRGNGGGSRDGGGYRGNREGGRDFGSRDGGREGGGYKGNRDNTGGSRDSRDSRPPRSDRGESRNPFAKEGGSRERASESRAPRAPRSDAPRAPRAEGSSSRAPKSAPRNAYKKD